MVVRFTGKVDLRAIAQARQRMLALPTASNNAMQSAVAENKPDALDELQTYPERRPVRASEYVSEKQRRYVYGFVLKKDANGNILPYQRTGGLADAWSLRYIETPNGGTFIFENTADAARYVGGTLAKNISAALKHRQPFHAKTGWQTYSETVQFWTASIIESYKKNLGRAWSEDLQVRGRAYTSPRG